MMLPVLLTLARNVALLMLAPVRLLRRSRACPRGGWVVLEIDGPVIEVRRPFDFIPFARKPHVGVALDRLHSLVSLMLDDQAPRGLLVRIKSLAGTAPAYRSALRQELVRLREGGKDVVVHLPLGGGVAELLVASGARRIFLGAQTTLGPLGFAAGGVYLRKALDRAGLEPDVHARGDFKTAFENVARDSMSDPQREQLSRMLDVLHHELVDALAQARRVDREEVARWLDRGLLGAEQAVAIGLADVALHDDEIIHALAPELPEPPPTVPASRYLSARDVNVIRSLAPRPRVAIIQAHGAIVEKAPGVGSFCEAEQLVDLLEAAADMPYVSGIVLHIDSPGGSIVATEKIHRAVAKVREKKPIVACFGGVSASGGYYVASAAEAIVARPTTITGSIGVIAARIVAAPLLDRLGIRVETVTRGAHADMLDPSRHFTDEERRIFDDELERGYQRFLQVVAEGRKRPVDQIVPLAGGRVWMGSDAKTHGLVDRLGGLREAIDEVSRRTGSSGDDPIVLAPPPKFSPPPFLRFLPGAQALAPSLEPALTAAAAALGASSRVLAFFPLQRLP